MIETRPRPIIVAASDRATRDAVDEVLSDAGYEVVLALDAARAVSAIERLRPSLILVDLELSGGGANAVMSSLGPLSRTVLLTNAHRIDAARWASDLGASACLNRPLDLGLLLGVVLAIGGGTSIPAPSLPSASVAC